MKVASCQAVASDLEPTIVTPLYAAGRHTWGCPNRDLWEHGCRPTVWVTKRGLLMGISAPFGENIPDLTVF